MKFTSKKAFTINEILIVFGAVATVVVLITLANSLDKERKTLTQIPPTSLGFNVAEDRGHLFAYATNGGVIHHPACSCHLLTGPATRIEP